MGFFSDITRAVEDVGTGGLAEFGRSDPFGVPNGGQYMPIVAGTALGALAGNPAAGASLGMGIFSGQQAASAQRDANAQNVRLAEEQMVFSGQQAQKQMDFQREMSNTSVQRMKSDMLAAGINPALAAGAGESTPSGAMGSYTAPHVDAIPAVSVTAMNSARDTARLFQDISESKSRVAANAAKAGVDIQTAKEKSVWATINNALNNLLKAGYSDAKTFDSKYGSKANPSGSFDKSWLGSKLNSIDWTGGKGYAH